MGGVSVVASGVGGEEGQGDGAVGIGNLLGGLGVANPHGSGYGNQGSAGYQQGRHWALLGVCISIIFFPKLASPLIRRWCYSLIPAKSNSSPHVHAQTTKRPRQKLNDNNNLNELSNECHNELTSGEIVSLKNIESNKEVRSL
nr:hypothetical protein [Tanacetum cinerariifolium]